MDNNVIKKSFSWDYLDKITTQGLSLIISIILARIISPEQYGIIAMATIFTCLLDVFVNPGFTSALIQKKTPESTDYSTVFWCNTLLSAFLYLVIFITAPFIESFYGIDNLALIIRVLALTLPFSGINSIVVAYIRKNFMYKKYFFVSLVGTFIPGTLAIVAAYSGFGIWALVIYHLGNSVVDAILSLIFISWKPTLEFSKTRFKSLYSFGGKMLYVKFIDVVYSELSGLIIGKKYSATDLSYYKKGRTYPQTIIQHLSMSVSDVLFPLFSNIQDSLTELKEALTKACKICDFVIYPIAIGFFACADNFVEVLLTDKWLPCVPYLRIMCLYYLCTPSSGIIYQAIKALGKGSLLLKMELIKKIYSIALILIALFVFDSPIYITVAITAAGFVALAINLCVAYKCVAYKITDYLKGVFPTAFISAVMLVAVYALNLLNTNALITLILQILTGIAVYTGLAVLLKFSQIRDLIVTIKKK